jgi:hypothetical protein
MREAIPLMQLVREMNDKAITTYSDVPKVYCKAFEDNSGALEIARTRGPAPSIPIWYTTILDPLSRKDW